MNRLEQNTYMQMEQPFLRVALEYLKKEYFNCQKTVDVFHSNIDSNAPKMTVYIGSNMSNQDLKAKYVNLRNYIAKFRDQYAANTKKVLRYIQQLGTRIDHLNELKRIETLTSEEFGRWSRKRLDRVISDYLLRSGHHITARKLAESANISDLVDFELYENQRKIENDLRKKSCTLCLKWCSDNKPALKRIKSTLEFHLRIQEFIENRKIENFDKAIVNFQKYLLSYYPEHEKTVLQVVSLLAFGDDTRVNMYRRFYTEDRWEDLITEFMHDNFALNALPTQSTLHLTLQAGLSALKTPQCLSVHESLDLGKYRHPGCHDCPVCQVDTFGKLAKNLPFAHHTNSFIVCRSSGKKIDDKNYPYALPNGHVYSSKVVQEQMKLSNSNTFRDPDTNQEFRMSELKKAYIT